MLDVLILDEDRPTVTTEGAFDTRNDWVPSNDLDAKGQVLTASGKRQLITTTAPKRYRRTTTNNLRTEHYT